MSNRLPEELSRFRWLLRKRRHQRYACGGALANPDGGQGRIIALLKIRDGISTKDMAYLLGVHFSSLNELLVKLEKNGYVVREPSQEDKRVPLVKLTEKGRTVKQEEPDGNGLSDTVATCLTERESEAFCGYLRKINAALQKETGVGAEELDEQMRAWHARRHACGKNEQEK